MPKTFYEDGYLDTDKKVIELNVDNLEGHLYDLISKTFEEVLKQANIKFEDVCWEEWNLTCKYFDNRKETQNA